MAPETIVAAVAANTTWNIQNANTHGSPSGVKSLRKNPLVPNQPVEETPNIKPKPIAQKANVPTEKSIAVMQDISAVDRTHVWAIGEFLIYFYDGASWEKQHESGGLNCIFALDDEHIWAGGRDVIYFGSKAE